MKSSIILRSIAICACAASASAFVAPVPGTRFTSGRQAGMAINSRPKQDVTRLRGGATMALPVLPTLGLTSAALNLKPLFAASLAGTAAITAAIGAIAWRRAVQLKRDGGAGGGDVKGPRVGEPRDA